MYGRSGVDTEPIEVDWWEEIGDEARDVERGGKASEASTKGVVEAVFQSRGAADKLQDAAVSLNESHTGDAGGISLPNTVLRRSLVYREKGGHVLIG